MIKLIIVIALLSASAAYAVAAPSLLQGRVYDKKTGTNINAPLVVTNASTGEIYLESHSNGTTGSYTAVITATSSCNIKVVVEAEGYPRIEKILKFVYTGEYQEIAFDIPLEVKRVPAVTPKPAKPAKKKKKGASVLSLIGYPTRFDHWS